MSGYGSNKREARKQRSDTGSRDRWPKQLRTMYEAGFSIVPQMVSKVPFIPWRDLRERQPTPEEVTRWLRRHPEALWAVVPGIRSGYIVLDFDGEEGEETRKKLQLPCHIRTPSGGSHTYVKGPGFAIQGGARVDPKRFPGMDVRADGQLATFFGNRDGRSYTRTEDNNAVEFDDLPKHLRDFLTGRSAKSSTPVDLPEGFREFIDQEQLLHEAISRVGNGTPRNEAGFELGCHLRDERLSFDEALTVMEAYAAHVADVGSHPYRVQEAYNSLVSAFSWPPRSPRNLGAPLLGDGYRRTDYGNAERLVAMHGDEIRYCHVWRQWLFWTGQRWEPDVTGEIERRAKQTVRRIYDAAKPLADPKAREALIAWAKISESAGKISAMVRVAESEAKVVARPDQFDRDTFLLNVANGTIDLRTGMFRAHAREDLITRLAPMKFDPHMPYTRWRRFLKEVMPDPEDRRWLQRAIGYSLTGETIEQSLYVFFGLGANGKTTFLEVIGHMLGDYALQATSDLLLAKRPGGVPNDIARMKGARFVAVSESDDGRKLSEATVKQMTGGEKVTGRFLYQEFFEFEPQSKLFFATNHKPTIQGTDEGIWRRIKLVPWSVSIPAERRDRRLKSKLLAELPGILNWALEGLAEWLKSGLGTTSTIEAATQEYRSDEDLFGSFIAERAVLAEDKWTPADELYAEYLAWCADSGVKRPWTTQRFGRALGERGLRKARRHAKKEHGWWGIALAASDRPRKVRYGVSRVEPA